MKHFLFIGLFTSVLFSCSETTSIDETQSGEPENIDSLVEDDVIEIEVETAVLEFTALADDNPSKSHFEGLLNSFYEDFEELPFGEVDYQSSELVYGFTLFRTIDSKTSVKFFFADHQDDLITFGKANFEEGYYGVNGGGLYLVSGEDEQAVNDVLSWFAGQE